MFFKLSFNFYVPIHKNRSIYYHDNDDCDDDDGDNTADDDDHEGDVDSRGW